MRVPLVIIDMQSEYKITESSILLNKIVKHIRYSKKRQDPIIIVELEDMGLTHPEIMKEIMGYNRYKKVIKAEEDGSLEITRVLQEMGILRGILNVCGIFSEDCVEKTAIGLMNKGFKVDIIEEACCSSQDEHDNAMYRLSKLSSCRIIFKGKSYRYGELYE